MTEQEFDSWLLNNIKLSHDEQTVIQQKMRKLNKRIALKLVALPVVTIAAIVVWKQVLRTDSDQTDSK